MSVNQTKLWKTKIMSQKILNCCLVLNYRVVWYISMRDHVITMHCVMISFLNSSVYNLGGIFSCATP